MPKHKKRILVVRVSATDTTHTPPVIYNTGRYEYEFPNDAQWLGFVNDALARYRVDYNIPGTATVTYTTSTYHR